MKVILIFYTSASSCPITFYSLAFQHVAPSARHKYYSSTGPTKKKFDSNRSDHCNLGEVTRVITCMQNHKMMWFVRVVWFPRAEACTPVCLFTPLGVILTVSYVIMFLCFSLLPSFAPGEVPSRASESQVSAGKVLSSSSSIPQASQGCDELARLGGSGSTNGSRLERRIDGRRRRDEGAVGSPGHAQALSKVDEPPGGAARHSP